MAGTGKSIRPYLKTKLKAKELGLRSSGRVGGPEFNPQYHQGKENFR
jgi:hypothetical protein